MKERTRLGLSVLGAGLLLGVLGDALLREGPWGLNFFLWVGALVAAFAALARRKRLTLPREGRWLLPCALAAAFAAVWRDSPTLMLLDGVAILVLLALALRRARGGRTRLAGVSEYARGAVAAGANAAFGPLLLAFNDIGWKEIPRRGWSRNALAVVRGLAIAAPLVLVFGALFVAADAVYEGLVQNTFNFDGGRVASHVILFAVFAWLSAGFLRGSFLVEAKTEGTNGAESTSKAASETNTAGETVAETSGACKTASDGAASAAAALKASVVGRISLGVVEVGVVLGLLNALFFSFVAVQLGYLFGGAKVVVNSSGMTYAEYARRGFFELVWVAALVLPLLLAAHWLLRKENPAHERVFRALSGGLLAMLFVIMASAVVRMRLYQSEYGQTELRFYTTAFMVWLAVVFVWFALTVLRGERERFACGALVSALVVLGVLHAANPDALIVRTNAGLVGRGKVFDACYASRLSADAVPALVELLPSLGAEQQSAVASNLLTRWSQPGGDWRTWNQSRARARRTVAASEETLRAMSGLPLRPSCYGESFRF